MAILDAVLFCVFICPFFSLGLDQEPAYPEKPIVLVVPSYNNSRWYQKNIDSIASQKYSNFRVIYLDDCSPDGTGELVEEYIKDWEFKNKITLIRNTVRCGALANIYTAVHMCDDHEIVITVDGDDWLKHDQVLARVNKEYSEHDTWMTYGHYEAYPDGNSEPLKKMNPAVVYHKAYREWDWITSHLRTCYAWLFKSIKLQDFFADGVFFDVSGDVALMFPMLEMAGKRARPIPDVLYVYNCANPINDFKTKLIRQLHCDKLIRSWPKYSYLKNIPESVLHPAEDKVHVIIFAEQSLTKLSHNLESFREHVSSTMPCVITVMCHAALQDVEACRQFVEEEFKGVRCVACDSQNYKEQLLVTIKSVGASHLFFMSDQGCFIKHFDMDDAVRLLKKTHAHGIYCVLDTDATRSQSLSRPQFIPVAEYIEEGVYAWQFSYGEQEWRTPYAFNGVLYCATEVLPHLEAVFCTDLASLEQASARACIDMHKVGLFFQEAKVRPFSREK